MSSGKLKDDEDRAFVSEFIETYRSLPCLWDVKRKDYTDRNKKFQQYEVLLEKYKEKYPDAQKADVTRKINTLRTNFRRELKRLNDSNKGGSGVDNFNEPTLWYFNEIRFIKDSEYPCSSRSTIQEEQNQDEGEPIRKKIKKNNDPIDQLIALATQRLQKQSDSFKKMADVWASKLRVMNPSQQLYAEKFINEIIFEGVLGNLNRNAVQIVPQCTTTPKTSQHFDSDSYLDSSNSFDSRNSPQPTTSSQVISSLITHTGRGVNRVFYNYLHPVLEQSTQCKTEQQDSESELNYFS